MMDDRGKSYTRGIVEEVRTRPIRSISPTEQVLRQFRKFVPPEPQPADTGESQNNIPAKILTPQVSTRKATGLVEEGATDGSMSIKLETSSYDWSKPVVKRLPHRYKTGSRTTLPSSEIAPELIPIGCYGLPALSPVQTKPSFWESLSWLEYLSALVVVTFISISLFYPGGVSSFREDLGTALEWLIPDREEPGREQLAKGKQITHPPTTKPQTIPRGERKRGVVTYWPKRKGGFSQLAEETMPPAVVDFSNERQELSPAPVEYVEKSGEQREVPSEAKVPSTNRTAMHVDKLQRVGTRLTLELVDTLRSDAKMTAAARVTVNLLDRDGQVLIPAGTTVTIPFLAVHSIQRMVSVPLVDAHVILTDGRRVAIKGEVRDAKGFRGIECNLRLRDDSTTINDVKTLEVRAGTKFFFQLR